MNYEEVRLYREGKPSITVSRIFTFSSRFKAKKRMYTDNKKHDMTCQFNKNASHQLVQ